MLPVNVLGDVVPLTEQSQIKLHPSWLKPLQPEFQKPYMVNLKEFLKKQIAAKKVIYPPAKDFFAALDLTPLEKTKVVMLGQDPYHGPKQAHGLCFSVQPGVPQPPSLKNIFIELQNDLGIAPVRHGYLKHWAEQGVLLLNSVLSVEDGKAGAHQNKGWEEFTDRIIHVVNDQCDHVVFVLWGSYAQKKASFVDVQKHLVLKAPHPSPLSSYRGFFGSKPFSKANDFLIKSGRQPIDWRLPEIN